MAYLRISKSEQCSIFFTLIGINVILFSIFSYSSVHAHNHFFYTVLNHKKYQSILQNSRQQINTIIDQLHQKNPSNLNDKVMIIIEKLLDKPYIAHHAMGEGDWQPRSHTYQPYAAHIDQNLVYRSDGFDCLTFVQIVMALLYANNLAQFETEYINIAYHSSDANHLISYAQRNHFVDADFNPHNRVQQRLRDSTTTGIFAPFARSITTYIDRAAWFKQHTTKLADTIQVFHPNLARPMYSHLLDLIRTSSTSSPKKITISYLPKQKLVLMTGPSSYVPNQRLFDALPTPALVEIVRNPTVWNSKNQHPLTTISHLGIIYRQQFGPNALIYNKVSCIMRNHQPHCITTPIYCRQKICKLIMFAHATNSYPDRYRWHNNPPHVATCEPDSGFNASGKQSSCNRVVSLPLFNYFTDPQYGMAWNMALPSIIGIHIEQLM